MILFRLKKFHIIKSIDQGDFDSLRKMSQLIDDVPDIKCY